ncbi:MAG: tetratricopeptide repeat protein, partial [bacterium]|nr:tetratricopeptide repeat protein [bacterium]
AVRHWTTAAEHGRGEQAQQHRRNAARALIAQGDQAYRQRDIVRALRAWQEAIKIAPGTPEAQEARQKFDAAIKDM